MSDPPYDDAGPDVGVGVSTRQMDITKAKAEARAKAEAKAKTEAEAEKQRLEALAAEEEAEQRAQAYQQMAERARKPSGVITAEERLQADPDAYTLKPEEETKAKLDDVVSSAELDRQAKHRELIDSLKLEMASGREIEAVAKDKAKAAQVDTSIVDSLVKMEESILKFEGKMRLAGKQLGMEAQEAWKEGDVIEAFAKGTAAFSARAGTGIIEGVTFIARPIAIGRTVKGLVEGAKKAIEHPEEIPSGIQKWAEHIARDPGSIAEFAGDVAAGFALSEVISAIKGPTHKVSRIETIDIDVKAKTLGMVDEIDPFTGEKLKVLQFPEADLTPTVVKKKIPKVVSEIMDTELDDISGKTKILGVADEGGITVLDKIDLPEGVLDDLLEGKRVKVDGIIDTETVKIGSETFEYVDEIADPFTGTKTTIPRTGKATILDAKEIGVTMEVAEDASKLSKLALEVDETQSILPKETKILVTKPPPDIDFNTVKFKSLWGEEGVKEALDEGKRSYDIKGMVTDTTKTIDDVIDDIKPIDPTSGPKTPLSEHFQQPGYTASMKDISDSLAKDITIVRELTEGVKPVSKVITDPTTIPKGISASLGMGAALVEKDLDDLESAKPPVYVHKIDPFPPIVTHIQDPIVTTKPIPDELPLIDIIQKPIQDPIITPIPVIDEKTFVDTKPLVIPQPIPSPIKKPTPTPPKVIPKPIQDVIPIIDVIQEPIQDPIVTPITDVVQKQKTTLPPPHFRFILPKTRHHKIPSRAHVRRDKMKKIMEDPLGWELRKYKMPTLKESKTTKKKPPSLKINFSENKKKKKKRLPKL